MEKTKITVDLGKKKLHINERAISLEDSLVGADVDIIPETNDQYAVNLHYAEQREGTESPTDREMDKLEVLRKKGYLPEEIEVYATLDDTSRTGFYTPSLSLVGKMATPITMSPRDQYER